MLIIFFSVLDPRQNSCDAGLRSAEVGWRIETKGRLIFRHIFAFGRTARYGKTEGLGRRVMRVTSRPLTATSGPGTLLRDRVFCEVAVFRVEARGPLTLSRCDSSARFGCVGAVRTFGREGRVGGGD